MPSSRRVQPSASGPTLQQQESARSLTGRHRLQHALSAAIHRVLRRWHDVQIGNRGHYSVERVLGFRDYYERTSTARALGVCVLTPVPAALAMLLVDCIPMRPVEEGWKANKNMFLRVFVSAVFVGGGIVFLAKTILSEGNISTARALWITMASALFYAGLGLLLAASWKYPVPFGIVLMVGPFVTVIMTLILMSIDPRELKTNRKLQKQVMGHMLGSSAQSLLVMAYPTFNAVFLQLSGVQQAVFMFLLPVIKFSTKQVIAGIATHLEDYLGVVIVFTVDVFNVLYVAICMQSARSSLTTMLIMASDVVHIVLALRSIYYLTNDVQQHIEPEQGGRTFVSTLLSSLSTFKPRAKPYSGSIRLFGPYSLPLSSSSKELLCALDGNWNDQPQPQLLPLLLSSQDQPTLALRPDVQNEAAGPSAQLVELRSSPPAKLVPSKHTEKCKQNTTAMSGHQVIPTDSLFPQVQPHPAPADSLRRVPILTTTTASVRRSEGGNRSRVKTEKVIQEGLQVLFHCEYVVLTEYIECVLPLVYAGYLAGLFQLPTAANYPFTRSLTTAKMRSTLLQLVIYGSLEILSFVGLELMLKKRLGYSPLYQLAFVLETHAVVVQSLLFIWIPFIVQLTFDHGGEALLERREDASHCH